MATSKIVLERTNTQAEEYWHHNDNIRHKTTGHKTDNESVSHTPRLKRIKTEDAHSSANLRQWQNSLTRRLMWIVIIRDTTVQAANTMLHRRQCKWIIS